MKSLSPSHISHIHREPSRPLILDAFLLAGILALIVATLIIL
jgi:hypothetical protein